MWEKKDDLDRRADPGANGNHRPQPRAGRRDPPSRSRQPPLVIERGELRLRPDIDGKQLAIPRRVRGRRIDPSSLPCPGGGQLGEIVCQAQPDQAQERR